MIVGEGEARGPAGACCCSGGRGRGRRGRKEEVLGERERGGEKRRDMKFEMEQTPEEMIF